MKIEEISIDVFSGGTPNTKKPEYWNGPHKWLSSGETRNRVIVSTEKSITEVAVMESSTRLAKPNDILIASAGQGVTRGRASFCAVDTYINQSIVAVRPNPDLVDPVWLFYNIFGRYDELRRLSDANASRGSITTKLIKSLEVELPSIDEQRSVSRLLFAIEMRRVSNLRINAILGNIGNLLYDSVFVNKEIVKVKSDATTSNNDPIEAAVEKICGTKDEQSVNIVRELVNLFPNEFEQNGIPKGWK